MRPNPKSLKIAIVKFHSEEAAQRALDEKNVSIDTAIVTIEQAFLRPQKQPSFKVDYRPRPNPP